MKPKEILIKTLQHEPVDQVAWVPFAGVHAGKLKGYNAKEVLTDGDKLFDSLMEVYRLYKPHGQPVVFDLQLEAEALGCELKWADDCPPAVISHPLEDDMSIPCDCTIPTEESGRLPMVLDVMRRMDKAVGNDVALFGLFCGPFTLALHLRGNNIFMDMYDDAKYVKDLLAFCGKIAMKMSDMFIDAGMAVIAAVDPLISQISVDHFEEFMSPIYTEIFEHIRSKAVLSSFFVCGDATRNVEAMCETNPDSIFVDENVDLAAAKRITDKYNITIGGNLPLTTVMLHGTQQDNMKCVIDELDSIQDRHNLVIAPGCDMPYDTPIESTIGIVQAIYNEADVREMLKDYTNVEEEIEVELPNYEILKKPLIEVFTLDSATCAACTYMMGAAEAAKNHFGYEIDMIEYKYTIKENIARIKKMGVPNLPSMYINGELKYRSIIPSREELFKAIKEAKGSI